MSQRKIKTLEELVPILDRARAGGAGVVQCHGVFDLLHVGHIRHFQQAAAHGEILVVTVTTDRFVRKGPSRPVFDQQLRAEAIAALDVVDYVALSDRPDAGFAIETLRPDCYVKGSDYAEASDDVTGGIVTERKAVERAGGRLVFTEGETFSSSSLINRFLSPLPRETSDYLQRLGRQHAVESVVEALRRFAGLRVLVVGETILDVYCYGDTIGRSAKGAYLTLHRRSEETFAGGAAAVANHAAGLSREVRLLSFLGDRDSHEDEVRERLKPNVEAHFLYRRDSPTIVKRRYVDGYFFSKLFEEYVINDGPLLAADEEALCSAIRDQAAGVDVVIAIDYGHGMLSARAVEVLCEAAPFLAVNTQANAGNLGFHTIGRYPRADFVCLAEPELRLEARERHGPLDPLVADVARRLGSGTLAVTRGKLGCRCYAADGAVVVAPALTENVVDRVGSGDAFLALASLAVAQRLPLELTAFLGNVAGAEAVATVGNRDSLEFASLTKHVTALLK